MSQNPNHNRSPLDLDPCKCGGQMVTYCTKWPVRYIKCRKCGHKDKAVRGVKEPERKQIALAYQRW